ncbi:S-adenosyl-L-methionine-dependent methyltransferase [Phycomyces nitens]|nr:S-adenosyl-L-methionine-dependent methyltransferase [Phycomyces nitens]
MGSQLSKDSDSVKSGSRRRRRNVQLQAKVNTEYASRPTQTFPVTHARPSRTTVVNPINHKVVLMTDQITPLSSLSSVISTSRHKKSSSSGPTSYIENRSISSFTSDDEPRTPTQNYSSTNMGSPPTHWSSAFPESVGSLSPAKPYSPPFRPFAPTEIAQPTSIVFDSNVQFVSLSSLESGSITPSPTKTIVSPLKDNNVGIDPQKWIYEYGAEKERDRQWRQHYVLKMVFGGNLKVESDKPLEQILDCGCGVGLWTLEMAQAHPGANVIGLDVVLPITGGASLVEFQENQNGVCVAGLPNLKYLYADLLGTLPFPDNTFDLVHQRDVATVVPAKDWPNLVKELQRVLKPGGRLQLVEYDILFKNPGPVLALVNEWYKIAASTIGVDPHYVRSMEPLLQNTGFEDIKETVFSIPIGEWPDDPTKKQQGYLYKEQMKALFKSMRKWWLSEIKVTPEEYERVCQGALDEFENHENAAEWRIFTARKPLKE